MNTRKLDAAGKKRKVKPIVVKATKTLIRKLRSIGSSKRGRRYSSVRKSPYLRWLEQKMAYGTTTKQHGHGSTQINKIKVKGI